METDFDRVIVRRHTNSVKWDTAKQEDLLPMWVADMDFPTAEPVIRAIERRARHGIYGYACLPDAYYEAEAGWWARRHRFPIRKEWIQFSSGTLPAIAAVIRAFTKPGDGVLIQSPVYNNFHETIALHGREAVVSELQYTNGTYEIDFYDFERKAADEKVKLFILCNPHNPVGKVWRKSELEQMGEICARHGVLVLADELHRDLVYAGHVYTPFASLGDPFLMNSITCTAPSKTFNLAGLKTANLLVADEALRVQTAQSLREGDASQPNVFGIEALIAAYNEGEEWLDQLLAYLTASRDETMTFLREKLPMLQAVEPEATYLIWIDCRSLGLPSTELSRRLWEEAGLRINDGRIYGETGEGFIRLNIACPRSLLREGLDRLARFVNGLN